MIRTKYFVVAIGITGPVLLVLGFLLLPEPVEISITDPVFTTTEVPYEVITYEREVDPDRKSAFIASVRSALRENPPEEREESRIVPRAVEPVRVAVPEGTGSQNYGDAPGVIIPQESSELSPLPVSAPLSGTTSTSTQR